MEGNLLFRHDQCMILAELMFIFKRESSPPTTEGTREGERS